TETGLQALLPRSRSPGQARERNRARTLHRPLHRQAAWRTRVGRERRPRPRQHLRAPTPYCEMNQPERVLIVEDEHHLPDGLRFNLEAEGYQVHTVDTGEAALEVLSPSPGTAPEPGFDVVVLYVMLPGKDGFTVV